MKLNCIAVDDEPLALDLVSRFIEQTPFLKLAGRFSDAVTALKAIHTQNIDVVFLDIQMPDLSGIELARVLDQRAGKRRIIFTTAYNQFAIEGYKVNALDYLLKPFNYEEFLHAANRALDFALLLDKPNIETQVAGTEHAEDDYIFLKVEYQLVRINLGDILYFEGLKDYVKVVLKTKDKAILSLTSLKALEEKLPKARFMRVHRSFIVSLYEMNYMTKSSICIGKILITVGYQYKDAFMGFLRKWV